MDATYRADLRELNELNFARVDARIGEVKHEMLRWMLASWSTMMLVLLGTLFAVLKAR